jgi:hypothetical protein
MANPFDAVTNSLKLTSASEQLQSLRAINDTLMAESLNAMQSSAQPANGGGGSGGSILEAVGGALAGGLGLSSLISGVADLFGGGGSDTPAAPTPYMQPLPIQLDAGFSSSDGGASFGTDFAQGGAPRAMTSAGSTSGSSTSGSPTQITVQVQALDSQSFLDRSQDIAMAVRRAMLESTVLNDVIREV